MTKNINLIRNSFGGVIGNIMEWYDFAVFGFLAHIITLEFFPNNDPITGLILTYGIFATGYMMRPLGGLFFGFIGDKMGRKKALIISIFMMAIPTMLIGLLPTYEQIGIFAPILLILLRMVQGLSVGGELIGSVSFMVEIASKKHRSFFGSLTLSGAVGGLLLGSGVVTILTHILDEKVMYDWGWRIPFVMGILILIIGLYLRKKMTESQEFLNLKDEHKAISLKDKIKDAKLKILHLSLIISLATISTYILFVWMPTYLSLIVNHPLKDAFSINTFSMLILFITIPISGYLSDIFGRKKIMINSTIAMIVFVYPLFLMLENESWYIVTIAQVTFALIVGFLQGPMPSVMADMFPTHTRYTSIGIGYNFSVALLGGTAPMVATWLIKQTNDILFVSYYIAFFGIISLIGLLKYKPKHI